MRDTRWSTLLSRMYRKIIGFFLELSLHYCLTDYVFQNDIRTQLGTLVQDLTVCNDFALFDCTTDITGTGYRSGYIVESD